MSAHGHPSDETWSAYLDGERGERETARLRAHLAACPRCEAALEDLRGNVLAARGLERPDPPVTLWSSIEGRLAEEDHAWWRLRPFALGGLAGALAVLGAFGIWWKVRAGGEVAERHGPEPAAALVAPREVRDPLLGEAEREVAAAAATYERSIGKLRKLLDRQTSSWDPSWRARTADRLARLDQAIAESRRALGDGTADPGSHESLFAAYQRKLDFLADAVNRGTPAVVGQGP